MKHFIIVALAVCFLTAWFPGKRLKNRIQGRQAAACSTCS